MRGKNMLNRIKEIRDCLEKGFYEAALALSLTLPDICGIVESPPGTGVGERYRNWIKNHVDSTVLGNPVFSAVNVLGFVPNDIETLTADDIYNLRCSFLHSGDDDIKSDCINEFKLVKPGSMTIKAPIHPIGELLPEELLKRKDETQEVSCGYRCETRPENGQIVHKVCLDIKFLCDMLCDFAEKYYKSKPEGAFDEHKWTLDESI